MVLTKDVAAQMIHNAYLMDSEPDGCPTHHEDGELVIYTGVYRWKDGSYHTEKET